jgi:hypothetical protein
MARPQTEEQASRPVPPLHPPPQTRPPHQSAPPLIRFAIPKTSLLNVVALLLLGIATSGCSNRPNSAESPTSDQRSTVASDPAFDASVRDASQANDAAATAIVNTAPTGTPLDAGAALPANPAVPAGLASLDPESARTTQAGSAERAASESEGTQHAGETKLTAKSSPETMSPLAHVPIGDSDDSIRNHRSPRPPTVSLVRARYPGPTERLLLLLPGGPLVVDVVCQLPGDEPQVGGAAKPADSTNLRSSASVPISQVSASNRADSETEAVGQSDSVLPGEAAAKSESTPSPFVPANSEAASAPANGAESLPSIAGDSVAQPQTPTSRSVQFLLRVLQRTSSLPGNRTRIASWLDRDDDGVLQPNELDEAPIRLMQLDQNDDRLVTIAESTGSALVSETMMRRQRSREEEVAVYLPREPNWAEIRFQLEERYGFDGALLVAGDWPQTQALFQQLDTNHDGSLQPVDYHGLTSVEPDLFLVTDFRLAPGLSKTSASTVAAVEASTWFRSAPGPSVQLIRLPRPDRLARPASTTSLPVLPAPATYSQAQANRSTSSAAIPQTDALSGMTARVKGASEDVPSAQRGVRVEQPAGQSDTDDQPAWGDDHAAHVSLTVATATLAFGVRTDPLFAPPERVAERMIGLLDRDNSGDLGADEVPDQTSLLGIPFDRADTETNGRLSQAELVAALTARRARYATQIVATVTLHEDPLFAILDRDHDDRLDESEMIAAAATLKRLDGNQDGQVQRMEVPVGVRVIVWHGETPVPLVEAILPAPVQHANVGRMPTWFHAMDANGDGRIAEREFLGPLERFAEFDQNRNGFWEPDEQPESPADGRRP